MIEHVYRRAARTPGVSRVIVATDDDRIRSAVARFGGEAVMTRAEHPSGTDRLAEVALALDCDLVVNVQGDEPLIDPAAIAQAMSPFTTAPDVLMTTLRRRLESTREFHDPAVVKVVVDRQGDALYFSRAPIPHGRGLAEGLVPACTFKHVGLYVYRRDFLLRLARLEPTPLERAESLEQLRALEHGYRIRTVETTFDSIGVDTAEDLDRVRRLIPDTQTT
jgi:3-deoxy-manno-octulosonate cytidylyltransferase (CMP-KDO synthetase)